jgi:hypothetical protein
MRKQTTQKPIFSTAKIERNPEVVHFHEENGIEKYDTKFLKGSFYRINPDGWREIFLLQMLEMRHEKFAPAKGNGVLISKSAFEKLTA